MVSSKAKTVTQYLSELPADRREAIVTLRKVFLDNIDDGVREVMSYGMIGYQIPLELYPDGYHCSPDTPLPYANLASQKNHLAIYMMGLYMDPADTAWFQQAWKAAGKRLDMGKSCVRFKKIDDVPLDVVAEAIRRMPSKRYIMTYEANLLGLAKAPPKLDAKKKKAAKKIAKKTAKK